MAEIVDFPGRSDRFEGLLADEGAAHVLMLQTLLAQYEQDREDVAMHVLVVAAHLYEAAFGLPGEAGASLARIAHRIREQSASACLPTTPPERPGAA